jgi:hypothetical protein
MPQYSHWHYILGYLIVLTAHNWPVMVALAMASYSGWRLYQAPTRSNVQWLYGWTLLALTYEYIKHLGDYLAEPVGFLLTTDWAWIQPSGRFLIQLVVPSTMIILALLLLLSAIRLRSAIRAALEAWRQFKRRQTGI